MVAVPVCQWSWLHLKSQRETKKTMVRAKDKKNLLVADKPWFNNSFNGLNGTLEINEPGLCLWPPKWPILQFLFWGENL